MSPPYSPSTQSHADPQPARCDEVAVLRRCLSRVRGIQRSLDQHADGDRVSIARIEQADRGTTALQRVQARREA